MTHVSVVSIRKTVRSDTSVGLITHGFTHSDQRSEDPQRFVVDAIMRMRGNSS